jgi:hypothetical protein
MLYEIVENRRFVNKACFSPVLWIQIHIRIGNVGPGSRSMEIDQNLQINLFFCRSERILNLRISVADPDPNPDPHVFGPPGSGSGSFYHHAKNSKKNLDS